MNQRSIFLCILLWIGTTVSWGEYEPIEFVKVIQSMNGMDLKQKRIESNVTCFDSCSLKGKCIGGKCACINGFYGSYCQSSVREAIPTAFALTQVFCCLGFFIIGTLATCVLVIRFFRYEQSVLMNCGKIIMIEIIVISIANFFMWSLDPFGFTRLIPFWLTRIFFIISFPLSSTIYCTVLFHWAEVYFVVAQKLKKENALKRVNSSYNPQITLESVLASMKMINKIKIPFILLNTIEWLIMIVREVLLQKQIIGTGKGSTGEWVQYFWIWYFTLIYGAECFGFFFWGPRLVNSMPPSLQARMRKITRLIQITSLVFFFCWLPVAIINSIPAGRTPYAFLGADWCLRCGIMIFSSIVLSLFIRVSKKAPFLIFIERSNTSNSDEREGGREDETSDIEIRVMESQSQSQIGETTGNES